GSQSLSIEQMTRVTGQRATQAGATWTVSNAIDRGVDDVHADDDTGRGSDARHGNSGMGSERSTEIRAGETDRGAGEQGSRIGRKQRQGDRLRAVQNSR